MTKIIKIATPRDAGIIALLARITFRETFGHYFKDPQDLLDYFDSTFDVAKLERSIEKPTTCFWVAYVDGLPVGYAKLKLQSASPFVKGGKVCQLQKIYVLKDFLSKKVGHALQNVLLSKAKALGYTNIWLSVLKENKRAQRFYAKNDFTEIGSHAFSIGKESFDFVVMTKALQ